MAANGRIVWVPAGTKGLRIKGWENKLKNMPEEATSNYATITVCILDGVDPGANAGAQGNATQLRHEQWCNNMHDTWNDTVADCTVKSIRMQNGQRSRHFLQRIEEIMSTKTEDDLVVFCYHGSAGGDGAGYTFNLTGPGPNRVNAHKLITKANESSADVLFILDCFFPTQSITQWKRDDHMTEIIIAGREMHDVNGRPIAGSENFDEAFSSAMRDILDKPRGEARQTIPRIMGRDKSLCTTPQRFWLNRPNRMHPEIRVWRFFFDIGRLKLGGGGGLLQLRRCEVTGRRKGEFGGDPDLENDGWGPGGGDGGDDDNGDDEEGDARYDGGDDGNDDGGGDGDSSNGGWGRGFGKTRRGGGAKDQDEAGDDAGNDNQGEGEGEDDSNSVVQQWAQLYRSMGLPKKLTDEELTGLVKRLQGLPKQPKRKQQIPTPSSSGISKSARDKRPASAGAEARGRSEVATRPRRNSPASPDCEIVTTKRVGHELGSPIDLSGETETIESSDRATRKVSVGGWLQGIEEYGNKAFVKLEDSPAPRASGDDTGSVKREFSVESESDLEITYAGPVNRPIGRGALIDLTDVPGDVTGDPGSLFIPEDDFFDND